MGFQAEAGKGQADAQRNEDRGNDEAGHCQIKQKRSPGKSAPKGETSGVGEYGCEDGNQQAQRQRAQERALKVAHALFFEQITNPMQRHAIHREGQPPLWPLKAEQDNPEHWAV